MTVECLWGHPLSERYASSLNVSARSISVDFFDGPGCEQYTVRRDKMPHFHFLISANVAQR